MPNKPLTSLGFFFPILHPHPPEQHILSQDMRHMRVSLGPQSEPQIWGHQKRVTLDLFRFFRFLPICSGPCFLFSGMPIVPICSVNVKSPDLFVSEQIRTIKETPLCLPLSQLPDTNVQTKRRGGSYENIGCIDHILSTPTIIT